MHYLVVSDPDGEPRIQAYAYGQPWPKNYIAWLELGELVALHCFSASSEYFRILRERGAGLATRFADELHLRLQIRDPSFRVAVRSGEYSEELWRDALAAAEEYPETVCRQSPNPDGVRIVLSNGRATWWRRSEARTPAEDERLMVQLPLVVWELLGEAPGLQAEVLELVEAGGGQPVAELVEHHIARLFAEDRIDEPLEMRTYSAYRQGYVEHIMEGDEDPVPARWLERRRRSEERIAALEQAESERRRAAKEADMASRASG
jgi:hypothetical protein